MKIETKIAVITVNDLNDKLFEGENLSKEELYAIANFEKFRLEKLNGVSSDFEFKLMYHKIQVMANLSPYTIFLNLDELSTDFK
jgi:sigma54-dependent transcription regulator